MRSIEQLDKSQLEGKRVLVRVDFNVPLNKGGTVAEDSRITAAMPTIEKLMKADAKVVLVSHLGRPDGKPNEKYSLKPVAMHLAALCDSFKDKVHFIEETIGDKVNKAVHDLKNGHVLLLENVRFHEGEEKNDKEFSKQLAELADVYVNDAFGTAHRAHASTAGVSEFVAASYAGFLLEKEVKMLSSALDNPKRPVATIIGGAKVSSKIGVLDNLIDKVDTIIIGGAMAFTFLKAQGKQVGKSLVEADRMDYCKELMEKATKHNVKIILPKDVVCAKAIEESAETKIVSIDNIPEDQMGLDVGPESIKEIEAALESSKTVLWNGPLGVFETKGFEKGTFAIVKKLVELTQKGCITVVGGGDSVAALAACGVEPESLTHVSTGGGASLEFLEGKELPGIACLAKKTATAK